MLNPRTVAGLALICCISACLLAQDAAEKPKKKKQGGAEKRMVGRVTNQLMAGFKKVNLTEEQVEKAKEIIGKHKVKLAEAQKAVAAAFTADQRKARMEAMKKFKAEGLKGKELNEKANEAAGLTEEMLDKVNAARKNLQKVTASIKSEIGKLLTDEQQAALGKPGGKKKKDGNRRPKKKGDGDGGIST